MLQILRDEFERVIPLSGETVLQRVACTVGPHSTPKMFHLWDWTSCDRPGHTVVVDEDDQ